MAIQIRRGQSTDFDQTKMKQGEFAVLKDTSQVMVSFADGEAEEIAKIKDIQPTMSEYITELTDLRTNPAGTTYATAGQAVRAQTNALLQSYIDEEKGTVSLLDGVGWNSGYYLNAGVPAANTNYSYCSYIDVSGMSEITITNVSRCDYAFYDADMNVLGLSRDGWATISDASTTTLTPHEDAVYFRFSCRTEDIANNSVTTISADDATVYTLNRNIENNDGAVLRGMIPAITVERDILAENEVMANTDVSGNEVPHVKYNCDIGFSAKITGFDGIHIAHGYQKYNASKVTIDDTYITVYKYTTSETEVFKQPHGLTISSFINATIKVGILSARLILSSSSGTFVSEEFEWRGARPLVRAYAFPGTKLTNCKLIWSSNALKRGIWWYGDSYVDYYGKLLEEYGYDNAMFDGFSGRASADAWDSLCSGLKFSNPNVIVWGMGMNDADNASSVNGVWKTYAQKVIDLCKARQIELIFLTIPNVPGVVNTFKNEFIKASGCSYIDIAAAVGGTETGSSWYDGLLGADDLHPSDIGKQVIASYITAQLPQLRRL